MHAVGGASSTDDSPRVCGAANVDRSVYQSMNENGLCDVRGNERGVRARMGARKREKRSVRRYNP
jgi:hypothetical protein